jgi:hypothetical protein
MTHFKIGRTNVADGQVSWSDKCQVGQMSVGQTSVGQMLVGQTSVGQTSVGQKLRHPFVVYLIDKKEKKLGRLFVFPKTKIGIFAFTKVFFYSILIIIIKH